MTGSRREAAEPVGCDHGHWVATAMRFDDPVPVAVRARQQVDPSLGDATNLRDASVAFDRVADQERIAVAVIGAGLMGAQIGCEYALGGHPVVFVVRDEMRARNRVLAALAIARGFELARPEAIDAAMRRMSFRARCTGDEPVELIVESLVEDRG